MAIASHDVAAPVPDRTVRHRAGREDVARYALVAVFCIVLSLFVLYPMAQLAWRSQLDNDGAFVGLANYARYFRTPAIAASLTNSIGVSIAAMVVTVALPDGAPALECDVAATAFAALGAGEGSELALSLRPDALRVFPVAD